MPARRALSRLRIEPVISGWLRAQARASSRALSLTAAFQIADTPSMTAHG
jgi:hypothetical protein